MFFYIGKSTPLISMACVADNLYLDKGWTSANISDTQIWYKGYSTDCNLSSSIDSILQGYRPNGKWCVITKQSSVLELIHPTHRGFPLFNRNNDFTNLKLDGFTHINFSLPDPEVRPRLSLDEATYIIGNLVLENIENFYKYNSIHRMNVLFSGGLDTLTVWSLLDNITPMYNLDIYIPKDTDNTLAKYSNATSDYDSDLIDHVRKKYWGYEISRLFAKPNWNITGFYAERHQLREVTNGLAYAQYLNKSMDELIEETDYLYHFLKRPDIAKQKIEAPNFVDEGHVKKWCYHSIESDNQMWHIDNNFHFSPLFDRRITETVYRLSIDDLLFNLKHGHIQKEIIKRFKPSFLPLLSDYKNSHDIFGNFKKNWKNVKLNPRVNISLR